MRNNRNILIEQHEIRHLRIEFLKKMRSYRAEERPIIYKDETYWVIQNDCGQVWQLCEWGTVNI
jgi:hypothetical protein